MNLMAIDPYIVLGSAVVGFLVGMTGAGGGALITPMLILLFGGKPSTAISSDLVAAVLMRPVGAVVHMTKKTVNYSLVGWMVLGSVPSALLGSYALHLMGNSKGAEDNVQIFLGAALLLGAYAMVLRYGLDRRSGRSRRGLIGHVVVRPLPTVAMLGALAFGHVEFALSASIVLGSVPAVFVGSLISSRAPDRYIRPVITFVIFASGLKYVGLSTTALGWTLGAALVAVAVVWLAYVRPRQAGLSAEPAQSEAVPSGPG